MGTISLSIQIVRPEEVQMIDVAYVDAGIYIGRYDLGYDSRLYQDCTLAQNVGDGR